MYVSVHLLKQRTQPRMGHAVVDFDSADPRSMQETSSRSSVNGVPAQCLGDHGLDSCRGLKFFICSMLVSC